MEGIIVEAKISPKAMKKIAQMAVTLMEEKINLPKEKETKLGYSLNELEDLYGIKTQTLARHVRDGLLKAHKPGKSYIVKKEDFLTYLKSNSDD
jgi:excisionase family DNA binding protein